MTAHDQNEASSRSSITTLTMMSACRNRPRIERSCGTAPLGEFEIIGVIDDAGGIGILVIDAEREAMRIVVRRLGGGARERGHDALSSSGASGSRAARRSSCAMRAAAIGKPR